VLHGFGQMADLFSFVGFYDLDKSIKTTISK
jgi:hypothetical protein